MRLRNTLAFAMLTLAASVSLTGCGAKDEPLTEAQMQRKSQELQLAAQKQQLDLERERTRVELETARLHNQAMTQQMLPPQQPVQQYTAPVQQMPVQQVPVEQGIGAGTALLGAAAVGAAGYAIGSSRSSNSYNTTSNYSTQPRPAARPVTKSYAPKPTVQAYKSPTYSTPKKSAGYTRMTSTKR